jgi:hypothetical protein
VFIPIANQVHPNFLHPTPGLFQVVVVAVLVVLVQLLYLQTIRLHRSHREAEPRRQT